MKFYITKALIALLVLSACKKPKPEKVDPPVETIKYLTVILNPDYLPLTKIDSAFVTWSSGTKIDSVKLTALNNDLVTTFSKLPADEKNYQLHLFTSLKVGFSTKLVWQKEFTATLSQKDALNIAAPLNINDANWKPRAILMDLAGLMAFSGIRPNDPYFRIHKVSQSWKQIVMDRSYWNTVGTDTRVGGAEWNGTNILDANGSYENNTFYNFLPTQIGDRTWDHFEIVILFTNADNSQTRLLDVNHTF